MVLFDLVEKKVRLPSFLPSLPLPYQPSDLSQHQTLESRWTHHAARIYSLSFLSLSSPQKEKEKTYMYIASGSLDGHLFVWSVSDPLRNLAVRHAGPGGVHAVAWAGSGSHSESKEKGGKEGEGGKEGMGRLVSAGADGCVRVWEVRLPA